ncbi:hypothetical protein HYH03_003979 [Edaphochlamys debaryana]|uniref:Uncharacterized protein n=1 Tax=Edaphochlamys debaryana TaxID=47281 RepID=A0A835YIF5_9CHLO|nr:hypothetical protein HYH03_003979 [Edaphochlamys debaryana]|eukprot:KAG2498229.1 hypothetical protein HYH03_003979 [Edaphochlamys debaryana]
MVWYLYSSNVTYEQPFNCSSAGPARVVATAVLDSTSDATNFRANLEAKFDQLALVSLPYPGGIALRCGDYLQITARCTSGAQPAGYPLTVGQGAGMRFPARPFPAWACTRPPSPPPPSPPRPSPPPTPPPQPTPPPSPWWMSSLMSYAVLKFFIYHPNRPTPFTDAEAARVESGLRNYTFLCGSKAMPFSSGPPCLRPLPKNSSREVNNNAWPAYTMMGFSMVVVGDFAGTGSAQPISQWFANAKEAAATIFGNLGTRELWSLLAADGGAVGLGLYCNAFMSLENCSAGPQVTLAQDGVPIPYNQTGAINTANATNLGARYVCPAGQAALPDGLPSFGGYVRPSKAQAAAAGVPYQKRLCDLNLYLGYPLACLRPQPIELTPSPPPPPAPKRETMAALTVVVPAAPGRTPLNATHVKIVTSVLQIAAGCYPNSSPVLCLRSPPVRFSSAISNTANYSVLGVRAFFDGAKDGLGNPYPQQRWVSMARAAAIALFNTAGTKEVWDLLYQGWLPIPFSGCGGYAALEVKMEDGRYYTQPDLPSPASISSYSVYDSPPINTTDFTTWGAKYVCPLIIGGIGSPGSSWPNQTVTIPDWIPGIPGYMRPSKSVADVSTAGYQRRVCDYSRLSRPDTACFFQG